MEHKSLKNRKGHILINDGVLQLLSPEELSTLFSVFFPTHIQHQITYTVKYSGYSEQFEKLEEGQIVPHYSVHINEDGTVNFEKIEEEQHPLE